MTLTELLSSLAEKYSTTRRPGRYFDVPKKGDLTKAEISYVKKRFKELVDRELCVKEDPENPNCYKKTGTDTAPKMRKRTSSYLADYEKVYRKRLLKLDEWLDINYDAVMNVQKTLRRLKIEAPIGLVRIAVETSIPIDVLKQVFDIGKGAYASSGSRTGMSAEQWGYGRVYSFIMCYFHNKNKKYSSRRYLKNKTDGWLYDEVVNRKSNKRKNPKTLVVNGSTDLDFNSSNYIYHASPKKITKLVPKPHYLAENPVVFGTHDLSVALTYLRPWDDSMFEQGVVGDDPPYMIEMYDGAFEEVFGGKGGYLYLLEPDDFYHTPELTTYEVITNISPTILTCYYISDSLKALHESNIQLIYFKDSDNFRLNNYRL